MADSQTGSTGSSDHRYDTPVGGASGSPQSGGASGNRPVPPSGKDRLLWVTKGLGPGGSEQLILQHALLRNDRRFDVTVAYVVAEKDHLAGPISETGAQVVCLAPRGSTSSLWPLRLAAMVRSGDFDLVHSHSPVPAVVVRLAALSRTRSSRPRLVSTEHNRWPRHRPATRLVNRLTFGIDDLHLAVSEEVASTVRSRDSHSVKVVEHGIDTDMARRSSDRAGAREELGIGDDDVVLCCLANFRKEKAHDVLLEAAADATNRAPHLRILLVGQGPLEAEVRDHRRRLGLGRAVLIVGYRDDAVRVLSAADALVLSSIHEGLPVALMEARALGLPVLATRVGGIPEAVSDGVDGLLVPPSEPRLLADALVRFATDSKLRQQLSAGSLLQAGRFDARRSVREIEGFYETLLDARPPSRYS